MIRLAGGADSGVPLCVRFPPAALAGLSDPSVAGLLSSRRTWSGSSPSVISCRGSSRQGSGPPLWLLLSPAGSVSELSGRGTAPEMEDNPGTGREGGEGPAELPTPAGGFWSSRGGTAGQEGTVRYRQAGDRCSEPNHRSAGDKLLFKDITVTSETIADHKYLRISYSYFHGWQHSADHVRHNNS